jgi:hypothetical protein
VKFNALEIAVLNTLIGKVENNSALILQKENSCVMRRDNTGAGFYAYIDVDKDKSPAFYERRDISGAWAIIDGLNNPMVFVVFLKDGYLHFIEGASVEEDTSRVDFSKCRFNVHMD